VISPTLPVDPFEAIKMLKHLVRENAEAAKFYDERIIVAGTSLGGFYALYLATVFDLPALLINPATNPAESLKSRIGTHTNYKTGEEFELTSEHIKRFAELKTKIDDTEKTYADIKVLLGTNDDVLDINTSKEYLKYSETFEYDTDHRFAIFNEVIRENEKLQRIFTD